MIPITTGMVIGALKFCARIVDKNENDLLCYATKSQESHNTLTIAHFPTSNKITYE